MNFLIFADYITLNRTGTRIQRTVPLRNYGAVRIKTFLKQKLNLDGRVIDFCFEFSADELLSILQQNFSNDLKFIGLSFTHMNFISDDDAEKIMVMYNFANEHNIPIIFGGKKGSVEHVEYKLVKLKHNISKRIKITGYGEEALYQYLTQQTKQRNYDGDFNFKYNDMSSLDCHFSNDDFLAKGENHSFIELSRGCIFSCGFCDYPYLNRKQNDYIRDKENLVIQLNHDWNLGIRKYFINDSTFNDNPIKFDNLIYAQSKIEKNFEFSGFFRIDLIKTVNDIDKIIDSNFNALFFGIESWNENSRKSCTKFLGSNADIENKINQIRDRYLQRGKKVPFIFASFIIGLPNDLPDEIIKDAEYIATNNIFDSTYYHTLNISPSPINNNSNTIKLFNSPDVTLRKFEWTNDILNQTSDHIFYDDHLAKHVNPIPANMLYIYQSMGTQGPNMFSDEDVLNLNRFDFYNNQNSPVAHAKITENTHLYLSKYKKNILNYAKPY